MRRFSLVAALVALVAAAGCNSSTSPGSTGGHTTSITVGNNFFSVTPDTINSGVQITWTWATPSNGHTVTWDTGPTTLPPNTAIMTSGTYNATLTVAGTYHYHCSVHGAAMSGVVVVQ